MNILITGGAGYIGHYVTKKLLKRNHRVTVLDNLSYGKRGIEHFFKNSKFKFIFGDISDIKAITRALKNQDAVIALAAIVGDPACNLNPDETKKINFLATQILINACRSQKIKRIVFASSCSVYGDSKNTISNETSLLNPLSLYAKTRVMSEELLLNQKMITPVILRLATVFGYSERMRFDLVVNFLTANAYWNKKITIFGGEQWRPNVYVQDAAEAFILSVLAPKKKVAYQIFNVGNEKNNLKINSIGNTILKILPQAKLIKENNEIDKRNYRVSFKKIRDILGFKNEYSVKKGIIELINKFSENRIVDFKDDIYYNVKYLFKKQ